MQQDVWKYCYWLDKNRFDSFQQETKAQGLEMRRAEKNPCEALLDDIGYAEPECWTYICNFDALPWYQATSLSLRDLVSSPERERRFWTIRLDTLTVHQLKATKKGVERSGTDDPLLRIRLSLPGLLAPFWQSDYWFTLPEAVFFRFEGPSGPPGSPQTIVTRVSEGGQVQ